MPNPYTIKNLIAATGADEETIRTLLIDLRDDADNCQMITKAQYETIEKILSGDSSTLTLATATNIEDQQDQIAIVQTANDLLGINLEVAFQTDFIAIQEALKLRNQAIAQLYESADDSLALEIKQRTQQRVQGYKNLLEMSANQTHKIHLSEPSTTEELNEIIHQIRDQVGKKLEVSWKQLKPQNLKP